MKCPKCSFENTSDSRFCRNCATPLPAPARPGLSTTQTLPTPVRELAPGTLFAGRYQVLEELGKGGMGRVYQVLDTKVHEKLALKLLDPLISADEKMIERFKRELKFARQISHRNVCRMYDLNETEGTLFITMEYVAGENLKSTIRRVGPLSIGKAVVIARQVCEGLAEAHRLGVVHRDLKPQNIMLDTGGDARIMDFGISRSLRGEGFTGPGAVIGTPEYMSPEQVEGTEADGRADLYALGIVLFEMVTGQVPFGGDSSFAIAYKQKHEAPPDPVGINPQISDDLRQIILKCLEKSRDRRYQEAGDLAAALAEIEGRLAKPGSGILDKKRATQNKARVRSGPRKRFYPAIALAALAAGAGLAVLFLPRPAPRIPPPPDYRQITFSGSASLPDFSPDGNFLAYVEPDPSGFQRVMIQDLSGAPPLEVFRTARCYSLRWLPNGSEISVVGTDGSNQRTLFLVPRLGGSARPLAASVGSMFITWSPDSLRYAYPQGAAVRIVSRTTGEAETVSIKGPFAGLIDLDWSPSGDRLAFTTVNDNREYGLGIIRTDGSQLQSVISGPSPIQSPRWSSQGGALYFLQGTEDSNDLCKIAISLKTGAPAGPTAIIIPGLKALLSFSVTKDGRALAYRRVFSTAQLWVAPVADAGLGEAPRTTVLTSGTSVNRFPSVSPDGRQVAFVRAAGKISDLFVVPLDGGTPEQLTFLRSMNYGPAWSPDGRAIAFISLEGDKAKVWKIASQGGQATPFGAGNVGGYSLAWGPGAHILFQTIGNRDIGMIDPVSGHAGLLLNGKEEGWLFSPKYSPDGKRVAVSWNRSPSPGIWSISLGDGNGRFLFSGAHLPVGWSRDGRWIYASQVADQTLEIIAVDSERGGSKDVLKVPVDPERGAPERFQVSMTPDGERFVFVVTKSLSDIWLIENFDPRAGKTPWP